MLLLRWRLGRQQLRLWLRQQLRLRLRQQLRQRLRLLSIGQTGIKGGRVCFTRPPFVCPSTGMWGKFGYAALSYGRPSTTGHMPGEG